MRKIMDKTLLEKALEIKTNHKYLSKDQNEMLELALAYAANKITSSQAAKALGASNNGASTTRLNQCLMTAIRHGKVKIIEVVKES
jgi:hypothetical protein